MKYKGLALIIVVFCIMVGLMIHGVIKYNKEAAEEVEVTQIDTLSVETEN